MSTTLELYTISIPQAQRKAVENLSVLVTNGGEFGQNSERTCRSPQSGFNEIYGRHEETRTPDLYRVKVQLSHTFNDFQVLVNRLTPLNTCKTGQSRAESRGRKLTSTFFSSLNENRAPFLRPSKKIKVERSPKHDQVEHHDSVGITSEKSKAKEGRPAPALIASTDCERGGPTSLVSNDDLHNTGRHALPMLHVTCVNGRGEIPRFLLEASALSKPRRPRCIQGSRT